MFNHFIIVKRKCPKKICSQVNVKCNDDFRIPQLMFRHTVLHRFLFIVFELFRFGPAVCVSSMAAVFLDIAPSEMFVSSVLFVKTPMSCCVLEKYEAAIFMFVEKGNWTEVQTLCRKEQIS